MDEALWEVYRRLAGVAISLTVFGVGAAFIAWSLYLPTIGAVEGETIAFALGFLMALAGLASAIVLLSTMRARRTVAATA